MCTPERQPCQCGDGRLERWVVVAVVVAVAVVVVVTVVVGVGVVMVVGVHVAGSTRDYRKSLVSISTTGTIGCLDSSVSVADVAPRTCRLLARLPHTSHSHGHDRDRDHDHDHGHDHGHGHDVRSSTLELRASGNRVSGRAAGPEALGIGGST